MIIPVEATAVPLATVMLFALKLETIHLRVLIVEASRAIDVCATETSDEVRDAINKKIKSKQ